MIPAPPRISAPPRPAASPAPTLAPPRDLPCPALTPPRGPSPATRPKANDADISTLPPRHQRFRPTTPLSARAMHVGCRVSSTTPVRHAWHHAYLGPLTPQPDGYLPLEQFNECGALPNRFSRAPHSWKVSSRGGVAAEVSGGREDGAAGGTGGGAGWYRSGEQACPRGRPSLGIVPSTPTSGSVGDPEDPGPTPRLAWGREIPPVRRKLPNGTMGGLARVRARLGTWQGLHGYA